MHVPEGSERPAPPAFVALHETPLRIAVVGGVVAALNTAKRGPHRRPWLPKRSDARRLGRCTRAAERDLQLMSTSRAEADSAHMDTRNQFFRLWP
jgi:hypothetical protein